ncbi:MAG: hypothetical protein U9O65_00955 [Thermotogota bacterium]|nr:hypothetical protein [Thermotogota bacterium]
MVKKDEMKGLRKKLRKQATQMSNETLRQHFWESREKNQQIGNNSYTKEQQKELIKEEIFSQELKKRELLEWALQKNKT